MTGLLEYDMGGGVHAFTAGRDVPLPCAVVQPHQTHSTVVAHVDRPGLTREDLEGVDALVTDLQGVAIGVRTADCIPVLLYDCLLYTSPSPRDGSLSRMPSSA